MHPMVWAIPRFIQLVGPLPPLKPMDQSRRGVIQSMEVQVRPLTVATPRFIQMCPIFNQMQVLCLPYLDHPTP
jgi:hypothetical protein